MAVIDHIGDRDSVGSLYRLNGMVCRFCTPIWSSGSAVFHSGDRKGEPSGEGRISVLSCTGRNRGGDPDDTCLDGNCEICLSVSSMCRYQFPDTGSIIYLLPEGYAEGIS